MKCGRCGNWIDDADAFCTNCGAQRPGVVQTINAVGQPVTIIQVEDPQAKKTANLLCIISLILLFSPYIMSIVLYMPGFPDFLYGISNLATGLLSLVSIGLMVYVRIKYPKNTFGKVIMWLYIAFLCIPILLALLFIVLLFFVLAGL